MKRQVEFQPTISGLVISILLLSMIVTGMGIFITGTEQAYGTSSNLSLSAYDKQTELLAELQTIQNATNIQQQSGVLDVIGGFFSSGYSALKISLGSFAIFESISRQITTDIPEIGFIIQIVQWIIFSLLIIGLAMAVLLKSRT